MNNGHDNEISDTVTEPQAETSIDGLEAETTANGQQSPTALEATTAEPTSPTNAARTVAPGICDPAEREFVPADYIPMLIKPGDYLIGPEGNITRVEYVDQYGDCLTVWKQPLLNYKLTQNGYKVFVPNLPAADKNAMVKCIDGSNTRSIIFEGINYRVEKIYDGKHVEIAGAAGLWPLDIFTVLE